MAIFNWERKFQRKLLWQKADFLILTKRHKNTLFHILLWKYIKAREEKMLIKAKLYDIHKYTCWTVHQNSRINSNLIWYFRCLFSLLYENIHFVAFTSHIHVLLYNEIKGKFCFHVVFGMWGRMLKFVRCVFGTGNGNFIEFLNLRVWRDFLEFLNLFLDLKSGWIQWFCLNLDRNKSI